MDGRSRLLLAGSLFGLGVVGALVFSGEGRESSKLVSTAAPIGANGPSEPSRVERPRRSPENDGSERGTDEEKLMRQLSRLQWTDKEHALALVIENEKRFEKGVFAEARRALRITLLVDLGKMDEARALTEQFIERFPESEYRPLVQGVTGIHPRPGPPASVVATSPR